MRAKQPAPLTQAQLEAQYKADYNKAVQSYRSRGVSLVAALLAARTYANMLRAEAEKSTSVH